MQSATLLHRIARQVIPLWLRQEIAALRRKRRDQAVKVSFAKEQGGAEWPVRVQLSQPVMASSVLQAKLTNLHRGAELLNLIVLEPGQVWSFWENVGRPSTRNGFAKGRNIVDGRLLLQVGGGLCQLSSLIYHLALLGGLDVLERYPHSVDIYKEEDRFTPLGADATVVWGVKDLRLQNPYTMPISIGCFLNGHRLYGEVRSAEVVVEKSVEFVRMQVGPNVVHVQTIADGSLLCETHYQQQQGLEHV